MQIWSTNSGWFQVFKFDNSQFHNFASFVGVNNKRLVLTVKDNKDIEGQAVGIYANSNQKNQKW
jgi:hypothetical protein